MHSSPKNPLAWAKKPKKTQKTQKKNKKNQKKTKKPTGLGFFFKKPEFFPTLSGMDPYTQCCGSGSGIRDWVLFDPWIRDPG
jgi:hypothetical protein